MSAKRPALLEHLHWMGHDSFRLDKPVVIYIDPWHLPATSPAAHVILVSHDHYDHCSPEDVQKVRTARTTVIANPTAAQKLRPPIRVLRAGEETEAAGVRIKAMPAYNIGKRFHPRDAGHVGFLIDLGEEKLYFAGDTDEIPEMRDLECDVALLPVDGIYAMTAENAARALKTLRARVALPMHYGAGVAGTAEDAERFRRSSPVPVVILPQEGKSQT